MVQFGEEIQTRGTRMSSRNPKVKAVVRENFGTVEGRDESKDHETKYERRPDRTTEGESHLVGPTDMLARDSFHVKREPIPKGKEYFPAEWKMQYADLYYPYAKFGEKREPLYIDLPVTVHDVALCERKLKVLRDKEIHYTYIKVGEGQQEGQLRLDGVDVEKWKKDQASLRRSQIEGKVATTDDEVLT